VKIVPGLILKVKKFNWFQIRNKIIIRSILKFKRVTKKAFILSFYYFRFFLPKTKNAVAFAITIATATSTATATAIAVPERGRQTQMSERPFRSWTATGSASNDLKVKFDWDTKVNHKKPPRGMFKKIGANRYVDNSSSA
jgi:hypothetical protein